MRWRLFVVATVLSLSSSAMALNYIGPPTTWLHAGQWAAGVSYSQSEQDLTLNGRSIFDDVEWDSTIGRVAVGLVTSRLEISGLIGGTSVERDEGFDTGDRLLAGGGFRVTMFEGGDLDWGIVGQGTYMSVERSGTVLSTPTRYDLDLGELQFGLGPCWRPGWGVVYGGALLQWVIGTLDTPAPGNFDVREKSAVGAYVGAGFEVESHWTLTAELQATPDAFGWGAGVQLRF